MRHISLFSFAVVATLIACSTGNDNDDLFNHRNDAADQSSSKLTTRSDGAILVFSPTVSGYSAQNPAFLGSSDTILFTQFHNKYNGGDAGIYKINSSGVVSKIYDPGGQDIVNLPGSAYNTLTNRITFASDVVKADNVWTSNVDGTLKKQLTNIDSAIEPSFSPDGSQLVFEYAPPTGKHRIAKVNADGTGFTYLTDGTHDDREPNWSPTGNRIVFQRAVSGGDANLVLINPDGSNAFTVPNVLGTDASFSPDGKWVVYSGGVYSNMDTVLVVSVNGGSQIRITTSNVYDGAPSWSPDGKWIAFESGIPDNPTSIWKIAVPASFGFGTDAGSSSSSGGTVDSGTDSGSAVDSGSFDAGQDAGCKLVCVCQ